MPDSSLQRLLTICCLSAALGSAFACRDATGPRDSAGLPGDPDRATGAWTAVGVGSITACAIDRAGQAFCWGANDQSQLGTADTALILRAPTAVATPVIFRSIAVGGQHQCALSLEGRAFCWGRNYNGQFGLGGTAPATGAAVTMPKAVAGGLTFQALTAGFAHTCGLSSTGAAFCWGLASSGQLGADAAAVGCDTTAAFPCATATPVPVAGGLRFAQVSAGRNHTCGVTVDGIAYCWGDNDTGALGAADVPVQCTPLPGRTPCMRYEPTAVSGRLRFAQIAAGALHTCGVTTAGAAYCWGVITSDPSVGAAALGNAVYSGYNGTQRGSRMPVPVEGNLVYRAVSAGFGGSCGLTVTGQAVCWGNNNFGQMGLGGDRTSFSARPRPVAMPAAAAAPSLGEGYNVCAPTTAGRIFCWGGYNFFGEIGSDPVSESRSPSRVFLRDTPTPVDPPRNSPAR